jgi:galactonate dehydratase
MRTVAMAHSQTGVRGMGAIHAVNIALWDLKAQALCVPLYELLGGRSRAAVLFDVHASGPKAARARWRPARRA